MLRIPLDGPWELISEKGEVIPATVPGCVHLDLLRSGRIEDPYFRDREAAVQWIGEASWRYRRRFEYQPNGDDRVVLQFRGLDTLAEVRLNGHLIGRTDNMHRTWEFPLNGELKPGANEVEVRFESPLPVGRARQAERFLKNWMEDDAAPQGRQWIRKKQCNFGWDWGPTLVTCGIWRPAALVGFSVARLTGVAIRQDHSQPGRVGLTVAAEVEQVRPAALTARATLALGETVVATAEGPADQSLAMVVDKPQLWWPVGMGAQPLYDLTLELIDEGGTVLDTTRRRIGLRRLAVVREKDQWGESFCFAANGVRFFAKGANWIPADAFENRLTEADYRRLIGDAIDANMNMLRVWGGGIFEQEIFYQLCDEWGVVVWQDFLFGCSTYPTFDPAWVENVRHEVEENVRRLRHHACIGIWCGNNEMEQGLVGPEWTREQMSWDDYRPVFDELFGRICAELDPERTYWPSSPHTPVGDRTDFNNPDAGDAHLWAVWHGLKPFEWYRTAMHRFCSEFGFQSFPEPRTVAGYTHPEDRNITSWVMDWHQRSPVGNRIIMAYMLDWFRMPGGFNSVLWASQILQGMAITYAVEHWRRNMPRCMGALYWQLNDCWPVASWSSIDYHGRWKALQYMARRFFAPVLLSIVEDWNAQTVEFHGTNDRQEPRRGTLEWAAIDVEGNRLAGETMAVELAPGANTLLHREALPGVLGIAGKRRVMVFGWLRVEGEPMSANLALFCRPKHLELAMDPGLTVESAGADAEGRPMLRVRAARPALWVWLELSAGEGVFSDNFFHLAGGEERLVSFRPRLRIEPAELLAAVRVSSLVSTY